MSQENLSESNSDSSVVVIQTTTTSTTIQTSTTPTTSTSLSTPSSNKPFQLVNQIDQLLVKEADDENLSSPLIINIMDQVDRTISREMDSENIMNDSPIHSTNSTNDSSSSTNDETMTWSNSSSPTNSSSSSNTNNNTNNNNNISNTTSPKSNNNNNSSSSPTPTITIINSNSMTIQSSSPSSSTYENIERMTSQRNQRKSELKRTKNKNGAALTRMEPIQSELLENDWLLAGYAEKQGRRSTMEDALVCELTFRQHEHVQFENKYESFVGIYDGHGGSNTSKLVSETLHLVFKDKLNNYEQFLEMKRILQEEEEQVDHSGMTNSGMTNSGMTNSMTIMMMNATTTTTTNSTPSSFSKYFGLLNEKERLQLQEGHFTRDQLIEAATEKALSLVKYLNEHLQFKEKEQKQTDEQSIDVLDVHTLSTMTRREIIPLLIRETFLEVNENICKGQDTRDGSTASVVYIPYVEERTLFVGNVGDSRVVLCRSGEPIRLTVDHRPSEIDERRRVKDAGGTIYGNRVNACLAVTRAIGDKSLHPYVISDASTMVVDLMFDRDEFIVIACDGLWDYVSEEEVVKTVRFENDPVQASIILRDLAYDKGSTDNISVIVVRFKPNVLQEYLDQ
ncbi:hypothetical protein C9374_008411 [Naegleria lovaniensis]|uniref:PPM-type phosphatase domain-containing protein n=1 Tax=Naegleria lovaniensis TaxID=51637 RepID=A0AA88KHX2_NAELO|nr:uncharacterized protein C9374_008411 [Naegleria lovaniensis]KAG2378268.1 hypothetical protein C9374_008411 [Naegleria lovaniensis]